MHLKIFKEGCSFWSSFALNCALLLSSGQKQKAKALSDGGNGLHFALTHTDKTKVKVEHLIRTHY